MAFMDVCHEKSSLHGNFIDCTMKLPWKCCENNSWHDHGIFMPLQIVGRLDRWSFLRLSTLATCRWGTFCVR